MLRRSSWIVPLACGLLVSGCTGSPRDAGDLVDEAADRVEEAWSMRVAATLTGASLARASGYGDLGGAPDSDSVTVETLDWSGDRGTDEGAMVLLRFVAHLEGFDSQSVFGQDVPEDDRTRCIRFRVGVGAGLHEVEREEVDCPEGAEARTAPTGPELPDDVEERTRRVLADADASTLPERAETAFPEEGLTVSTGAEDGRLVVAVGTGAGGDCSALVRERSGDVEVAGGFPREWLVAGELGCSADLVLSPPL